MRQLTVCLAVLAVVGGAHGSIFSVGHASGVNRKGKIMFENILANPDRSWKKGRSWFVCPDQGYYYITFHGLARKNSGLTLKLVRNKAEIVRAHGDGVGYNTASNSAIVYLNYGDKISLHVVKGNLHESSLQSNNFVTLSGYKLSSLPGDSGPQFGEGSFGFAAAAPGAGSEGAGGAGPPPPPGGAPPAAETEPEGDEEEFSPLGPDTAGPSR